MGAGTIIGQVLIELINVSLQSIRAAQIIGKAQAEGRDISDDELKSLDSMREDLLKQWQSLVQKKDETKPNE